MAPSAGTPETGSNRADAAAVLVIEDEPVVRLAVADQLERLGFRVLQAACAADALDIIQCEPAIALVFTDIRLPGAMDGIGLTEWIARHRPGMAVIVASGTCRGDEAHGALRFDKPYDPRRAAAFIGRTIAENRRR